MTTQDNKRTIEDKEFNTACALTSDQHMSVVWNVENLFIKNSVYICLATLVISLIPLKLMFEIRVTAIHLGYIYFSWAFGVLTLISASALLFLTALTKHKTANLYLTLYLKMPPRVEGLAYIEDQQNSLNLLKYNSWIYILALFTSFLLIVQIVTFLLFIGMNI